MLGGFAIGIQILTEAGQKLVDLKMQDFGAFVLASLSPTSRTSSSIEEEETVDSPSAVYLVNQLVAAFTGFDDSYEIQGERVYVLKRAQLVVACIHRRFKVMTCCGRSA